MKDYLITIKYDKFYFVNLTEKHRSVEAARVWTEARLKEEKLEYLSVEVIRIK